MTPIEVLQSIIEDCESDARNIDGQPFNGKSVGENFGHLLAMVAALASILNDHITEEKL